MLYCFHTAGVLHIFMLYNLLGPGLSFYRKSKINIKRKPNYEIGWFHNWPIIISHRLYAFHFTNDDLHDLYTLNSLSAWKGLKKFIPRDSLNYSLIYILFSMDSIPLIYRCIGVINWQMWRVSLLSLQAL